MGSNVGDEVMISRSQEDVCSEATTVEIKIKTLDSQTYTLRVDKYVPVPALKEQIATVTGVVSEQQRLICRGRVLKDDQLLSAYHVEDGHTLHLVVRQPISPMLENMDNHAASFAGSDHFPNFHYSQDSEIGPGIYVGTFNLSEQGDGAFPEIGRILSAVLGSLGVNNTGSSNERINNGEVVLERLSRTSQPNGTEDSSRQETDQSNLRNRSNPSSGFSYQSTAVPSEPLQPQVVPDSLTTLSQYLNHLRNEFSLNVDRLGNNPQAAGTQGCGRLGSDASSRPSAGQNGVPTPLSLAEVLSSTRGLLIEQVAGCLSQLASQLRGHSTTTNPASRRNVQLRALSVGVLLHNLGALLLELGRTTMTLRMGQTSGDAVVNAGPAVFISPSGPTPIMVQPPPLEISSGANPSTNLASAPGFLPRNIDIRIRSGSSASTIVNQREENGTRQSPEQTNPAVSGSVHGVGGRSTSSTREADLRVLPIRAVVARVPATIATARLPPTGPTHRPVGLVYPVITRVRQVTSRNPNVASPQPSNERNPSGPDTGRGSSSESARQGLDVLYPGGDGSASSGGGSQIDSTQGSRNEQFPRRVVLGMSQEAEPRVSDEGTFLSNLLHQILPLVTQNRQTQSQEDDADIATSSRGRVQPNLPSSPNPKRQKRICYSQINSSKSSETEQNEDGS